ncbi:hypothetical protein PAMP_004203 [Pampus punctatissimus]
MEEEERMNDSDMSSSCLLILLLIAPIRGQISTLLTATVGGSVLIPCLLPVNSCLRWFYWQESDKPLFHWNNGFIQEVTNEYMNRCQAVNTEFGSGNFSIRLNNVYVEDDDKIFWANFGFCDKNLQQQCKSSMQVSAPYRDLVLTINSTVNSATCTARGGYPKPRVSWTGQNKSSSQPLDLEAQTSLQQDPTQKTFSVTSTVSIKELKSVSCRVSNPRTNHSIENTTKTDAPGE